jgi:GGDEF domain-containing protein
VADLPGKSGGASHIPKGQATGWLFPTTISIGVASHPIHGDQVNSLVDKMEAANKRTKKKGKDQVALAA